MTDKDKRSSLLRNGINYGLKKFYSCGPPCFVDVWVVTQWSQKLILCQKNLNQKVSLERRKKSGLIFCQAFQKNQQRFIYTCDFKMRSCVFFLHCTVAVNRVCYFGFFISVFKYTTYFDAKLLF